MQQLGRKAPGAPWRTEAPGTAAQALRLNSLTVTSCSLLLTLPTQSPPMLSFQFRPVSPHGSIYLIRIIL